MARKSIFSLPVAFLTILGLSTDSKNVSREQAFWIWFQDNQDALLAVKTGQEKIFAELGNQIRKVDPRLVFEFGPEENGRREFTVSADGIKDAFPAVEALCAAAQTLPRWKILKFRQRQEPSDISYEGVHVKAESIRVEVKRAGDKADVTLFIPSYTVDARKTYLSIAFLMLDRALGEYDVEMRLGQIEIQPGSKAGGQTHSLKELPKVIDAMFVH